MNTLHKFSSSLADRMVQFIAFKRMQGNDYRDGFNRIGVFDRFLVQHGYAKEVLDRDILERFAAEMAGKGESNRCTNLSTVRQFSIHLHALAPESAQLPPRMVPRCSRKVRFYPLSAQDVGALISASAALKSGKGRWAGCMCFLVGLLYTTGLRISEALALGLGDIDLVRSTLFVRRGKFRKERLVPMSTSTREALDRWLTHRAAHACGAQSDALFISGAGRVLTRDWAYRLFRRLCAHCGLDEQPPPRLHDLRHNYACACIAQWRESHEDVNAMLPVLANAMGHANYQDTERYLHINAEALRQASGKFRQHVQLSLGDKS